MGELSLLTCQIEELGFSAKGIKAFQSYVCCLSVQHFDVVGKYMFINRIASDMFGMMCFVPVLLKSLRFLGDGIIGFRMDYLVFAYWYQ